MNLIHVFTGALIYTTVTCSGNTNKSDPKTSKIGSSNDTDIVWMEGERVFVWRDNENPITLEMGNTPEDLTNYLIELTKKKKNLQKKKKLQNAANKRKFINNEKNASETAKIVDGDQDVGPSYKLFTNYFAALIGDEQIQKNLLEEEEALKKRKASENNSVVVSVNLGQLSEQIPSSTSSEDTSDHLEDSQRNPCPNEHSTHEVKVLYKPTSYGIPALENMKLLLKNKTSSVTFALPVANKELGHLYFTPGNKEFPGVKPPAQLSPGLDSILNLHYLSKKTFGDERVKKLKIIKE